MTGAFDHASPLPGLPRGLPNLEALLERQILPEAGRAFVREAFTSDPARRVGGGSRNTVVRFASRKMMSVIQCESRTVEYAFAARCEHDPNTRLFLCQPPPLSVRIPNSKNRPRARNLTFDYLVYHEDDGFALVECKPQPQLEKDPRFERDGDRWRFPAAEAAAAELGLKILVFSSEEINPTWLRNVQFFADFVGVECPDRALCDAVLDRVGKARSLRVSTLLELMGGRTEALWWLVANHHVAADLERELIFDRDWGWVHDTPERMIAWRARRPDHLVSSVPLAARPIVVRIEPGTRVRWDGVPWRVLSRGSDKITLQRDDGTDSLAFLPPADVETLLERGALRPDDESVLDSMSEARSAVMLRASSRELKAALARYHALQSFRRDGVRLAGVSPRSLQRYARRAARGLCLYCSEFVGLISLRGRPRDISRLAPAQRQAIEEAMESYREAGRARSITAAYGLLLENWSHPWLPAPSYETLRRAVNARPRSEFARGRRGKRHADQLEGPAPSLDYVMPAHGDRAFGVGEIDHSPFDLQLVSAMTGEVLGTAYLSVLIDAYTRIVLAFVLRFGAPRRMPVLELLYECARRHGRVPDFLVVDQGAEFHSNDVEMGYAVLGVSKIERATGRPRQGAVMERLFGTSNERMTHQLLGNTEPNTLGRGLSASHRPSRFATWTLARAHQACERFFFEVYPNLVHGSLGAKPRDVFEHSMAVAGERAVRRVVVDMALRATLSETPKHGGPTRKVDGSRGVFLEYLWYWHPLFERGDVARTSVEVKVFPDDCGQVLAFVHGAWRRCDLIDGGADLAGRSRKQIAMVVAEVRKRHQLGRSRDTQRINAKTIGAFLATLGDTEAECAISRQALLDRENAHATASVPLPAARPAPRLVSVDGQLTQPVADSPPSSDATASLSPDAPAPLNLDFDQLEPIDDW